MAVYKTSFSGPIACKVLAVHTIREYIHPIHGNSIHYTRVSMPVTIQVTARKHSQYKRGEILEVFAMDIFDNVTVHRGNYYYTGKKWG